MTAPDLIADVDRVRHLFAVGGRNADQDDLGLCDQSRFGGLR